MFQIPNNLTGQQKKKLLKSNPNAHVSDDFKVGSKVLFIQDTYNVGIIKSMRFKNFTKQLFFKIELATSEGVRVVEVDQTQIYRYVPKWRWWLMKRFPKIQFA